jgi:Bacterial regulatory protein, Fis family
MFEAGLPLCKVERRHVRRTLHTVRGSRSETARLLQISVRCLQYKLKAYGQQSLRAERANFSNLERRSARKYRRSKQLRRWPCLCSMTTSVESRSPIRPQPDDVAARPPRAGSWLL